MAGLTFHTLMFIMLSLVFLLGLVSLVGGIVILSMGAAGKDLRTLANQTTQLASKGLAEDVAGLVGNASILLDAVHQMVRTTAGIGVFLSVLGVVLMSGAVWFSFQILQMPL